MLEIIGTVLSLSKTCFVSLGASAFEIFWRGSLPVELGLGLVSDLSRRTGESGVVVIV